MDSLKLSKSDLKYIFILASTIPVLSFILGFYTANTIKIMPTPSFAETSQADSKDFQIKGKKETKLKTHKMAIELPAPQLLSEMLNPETVKRYTVQAGVFSSVENAKRLAKSLALKKIPTQIVRGTKSDTSVFRVVVDSFDQENKAKAFVSNIEKAHAIKLYVADNQPLQHTNLKTAAL